MKKKLLFVSLLALLTACGETTPSSVTTSTTTSEETTTSETTTSEGPSTSEAPSIELTPKEKVLNLLKTGYGVKTTYTKDYNDGTSSPTKYYYMDYIGDGVAKSVKYSDEGFTKKINTFQYERASDNTVKSVSYSIDGSVSETDVMMEDSLIKEDIVADWDEYGFNNVFNLLTEDDFTLEDKTLTLNVKEDMDLILSSLSAQLFMQIEGYSTHYFTKSVVNEFSMTIDEEFKPVSFKLQYKDEKATYSEDIYKISLEGEFIGFGEELGLTKLTAKADSDTLFDTTLDKLKENNFVVSFSKVVDDFWDGKYTENEGTATCDGSILEVVKSSSTTGYKKIDETHYRQYSLTNETYKFTGETVEESFETLLPDFNMSFAFFSKQETDAGTVYTFAIDELMSVKPTIKSFYGFGQSLGYGYQLGDFTITITDDKVEFKNVMGTYTTIVTYSQIGSVSALVRDILE